MRRIWWVDPSLADMEGAVIFGVVCAVGIFFGIVGRYIVRWLAGD